MIAAAYLMWALSGGPNTPTPGQYVVRGIVDSVIPVSQQQPPQGTLQEQVTEIQAWIRDAVNKTTTFSNLTGDAISNHRKRIENAEHAWDDMESKIKVLEAKLASVESSSPTSIVQESAKSDDDVLKKLDDAVSRGDYRAILEFGLMLFLGGGGVLYSHRNLRGYLRGLVLAALNATPPDSSPSGGLGGGAVDPLATLLK